MRRRLRANVLGPVLYEITSDTSDGNYCYGQYSIAKSAALKTA